MTIDDLLTEQQAAEYLHMSPLTLRKWRCLRTGPRYRKIGKKPLYAASDLREYVDSCARDPREAGSDAA